MTTNLDNPQVSGVGTLATTAYFDRMFIGQAAASFGHSTGINDLGVAGDIECDGVLYCDGNDLRFAAAADIRIADNDATALVFEYGAGETEFMRLDTTTGDVALELSVPIRPRSDDGAMAPEWYHYDLADGAAAGAVLSQLNPLGVDAYVLDLLIIITAPSTLASTQDFGVAADGSTLSDTLIDGLSGAAAGRFNNIHDEGTNGGYGVLITSTQYITGSQASGDNTDLAGKAYVALIRKES